MNPSAYLPPNFIGPISSFSNLLLLRLGCEEEVAAARAVAREPPAEPGTLRSPFAHTTAQAAVRRRQSAASPALRLQADQPSGLQLHLHRKLILCLLHLSNGSSMVSHIHLHTSESKQQSKWGKKTNRCDVVCDNSTRLPPNRGSSKLTAVVPTKFHYGNHHHVIAGTASLPLSLSSGQPSLAAPSS